MLRKSRIVLLGFLTLGRSGAQEREAVYRLDTADYRIEMTVRFFPPYLGGRLVFYSSANPGKELCYSGNGDSSSCIERFVGALAAITYRFQPRRRNLPAAKTFREVVKVMSQSEGLDERPPYIREQPLVQGVGSDVQAFGYDDGGGAGTCGGAGGVARQDVESLPARIVPEPRKRAVRSCGMEAHVGTDRGGPGDRSAGRGPPVTRHWE